METEIGVFNALVDKVGFLGALCLVMVASALYLIRWLLLAHKDERKEFMALIERSIEKDDSLKDALHDLTLVIKAKNEN